jgi:transcriptional regulator with XRE-family HTH domain
LRRKRVAGDANHTKDRRVPAATEPTLAARERGRRIRGLRAKRRLTQSALARSAGVSASQIKRLERGLVENPTAWLLGALADVFEVDEEWLRDGHGSP